jgi:hypothetical protein
MRDIFPSNESRRSLRRSEQHCSGWNSRRTSRHTDGSVRFEKDANRRDAKTICPWIVYDLPAKLTSLRGGLSTEPVLNDVKGVKQGTNSTGSTGYFGPKPAVGARLPLPGICAGMARL